MVVSASVIGTIAWHERDRLPLATTQLMSDQSPQTSSSYPNCRAARSAGAAPLRVGEPGYGADLDRDGDGVACEPYLGNWRR